ncbi:MAG TPA: calcium-binding protein, partial [Vicinamibacterales bacterium]|nr:calcium-binding protein [Vicinamibacterales bacterium]
MAAGTSAGKDVLLLNASPLQLTTTNLTFAGGTRFVVGDNNVGTSADNGNNSLVGTSGRDHLAGLGGDDTLNGGSSADYLDGGLGNDTYFVSSGDVLVDAGGLDHVMSGVNWTLGVGFENLTLTGTSNILAIGNVLDNVLIGNSGNNGFSGRDGNDTMFGNAGSDTFVMSMSTNYGNDWIDGGEGVDVLDFGTNARTAIVVNLAAGTLSGGASDGGGSATLISIENVNGGAFNDAITGSAGANNLFGYNGNDTLDGGAGNDRLEGGGGNDQYIFTVAPGAGNADTIVGFASGLEKIVLDGTAHANLGANGNFVVGDGRFVSGAGLTSGLDAGDRVVYNTTTGQVFYDADGSGGGAAQLIATLQGAPSLAATDIIAIRTQSTINGTASNDTLNGTAGPDRMNGLEGSDQIHGVGGDDYLDGGEGEDSLYGGEGNDTLVGGPSAGNQGNFLVGGPGADSMVGGSGHDAFMVDNVGDVLVDSGGHDAIFSSVSLIAPEWVEQIALLDSASINATGNNLNNSIYGNDGANVLDGLGGNDWIDGDSGNDTLTGGAAVDWFAFTVAPGTSNADDITDFAPGIDKIFLAGVTHENLGPNGSFTADDARFVSGAGLTAGVDESDRVVYNTTTGQLFYDADGSGSGASQLIATVNGAPWLTASDIGVVFSTDGSVINGTAGNDFLVGTAGNDTIDGGQGSDTMDGGTGNDTYVLSASHDNDVVIDAAGLDTAVLTGEWSSFFLQSNLENVVVDSAFLPVFFDGSVYLEGNASSNQIRIEFADPLAEFVVRGGGGDDILIGAPGREIFSFGDHFGDDTVNGGSGRDMLHFWGNSAADVNFDTGFATAGTGTVIFSGVEEAVGTSLNDWMMGGTTDVRLFGWVGNDTLRGGAGDDTLYGAGIISDFYSLETGSDQLSGGAGRDVLVGGPGADTLNGGAGNDNLWGEGEDGEAGPNTFVFDVAPGVANADRIFEFGSGMDKIVLDGSVHAGIGPSGAFSVGDPRFHAAAGANAAHDADDRVILNTSTGELWYDADGSGGGAAQLIAVFESFGAPIAADFVVINGSATPPPPPPTGGQNITGTSAADTLTGSAGNDTISGLAGSDRLFGR